MMIMSTDAKELSAKISLFAEEISVAIERLFRQQDDILEDILLLKRRERDGETIDENHLQELLNKRKQASNQIGLLSLERTELFDDLPVIRLASGKLKVIASELEKDAKLIEETQKKIERATQAIQSAESLILSIISLVGVI
jgi:hypothetical protein